MIVFLLWITEEDCDGENVYLEDVYATYAAAERRAYEVIDMHKFEIEEKQVKIV